MERYSNEIRLIVSEKLKTANYILEDVSNVKEVIKIEQQMKKEQEDIAKTKKKDRYVGR